MNKKLKIIEKRKKIMKEWFSEEINFNFVYCGDNTIIEKCRTTTTYISWDEIVFTNHGWKLVFTKNFINFFIQVLNITDRLCVKVIKNIIFDADYKIVTSIISVNSILYKNINLYNLSEKKWDYLKKIFPDYKRIKKIYSGKEGILKLKKEFFDFTEIICERCGILLPAEAIYCSECGNQIISNCF